MKLLSEHRRFYAEFIVRSVGSTAASLIDAFSTVPREDFIGPGPWQIFVGSGYIPTISDDARLIYQDVLVGLAPDRKINNGQPSLHARCLAQAAPLRGEAVVHLGAGTGYYTAILATLVGDSGTVLAVEREVDLAARASKSLAAYPHVEVRAASAADTPIPACDLIYVNAGATHPLPSWLDALNVGGRLVFPLTPDEGFGAMLMVTRTSARSYAATAFTRVAFIPCIGARDESASVSLSKALERQSLKEVRSLRRDASPDASAWCIGNGWWLSGDEPR
jgi:protein-L-isoaspartate(D-aspartate) O-methyltransferase